MDEVRERMLEMVENNTQIKLTVGENYFDFITSTKDEGIKNFLETSELDLKNKHIILLGDSANDKGLFLYPFETSKQIIRVFLLLIQNYKYPQF